MSLKIKGIYGAEPNRENEYPEAYVVGHGGVTRIDAREQNLGEYGIQWFDVFNGDHLTASMNAKFVVTVAYTDAGASS